MKNLLKATAAKALWLISCYMLMVSPSFGSGAIWHAKQQPKAPQSNEEAEITRLREVIKSGRLRKEDPKQVVSAIKRLGELRAEPAVNDLVSLLTFRQSLPSQSPPGATIEMIDGTHLDSLGESYPAIEALFQIGKPALPALTTAITSSDWKSLIAKNATYAVMVIFRDNPRDGVSYLNDQASKSRTKVAADRLRTAAAEVKKTGVPRVTQP